MKSLTRKIFLILIFSIFGLLYHISQNQYTVTTQSKEKQKIKQNISQSQLPKTSPKQVSTKPKKNSFIYIQLSGAIKNPGVYKVTISSPIFKIIQKAGGPTTEAMLDELDLTKSINKNQKIHIPTKNKFNLNSNLLKTASNQKKININTASRSKLITLPGIGPKTAQDIIDYRQKKGRIYNVEILKNIRGIGEKKVEKLKRLIFF